jgi:uncharacterized protein
MAKNLWINLPVKNIAKSQAFFEALGFSFDTRFVSQDEACMIVNDYSCVMLLHHSFFETFTAKAIADTGFLAEAVYTFSADSAEEVDDMVNKALAAGGTPSSGFDSEGSLYKGSFQDIDGHLWEVAYVEPAIA